jgi:predicted AAA+ superfamily ATPase
VTSTSSGTLVNTGYLLENLVSTALRRTAPEIYYFKTKSGREVDFVFHGQDRFRGLIQVCESIVDPQARDHGAQRSHSRVESLARHHCDTWRDEQIQVESGKISIMPAWRFVYFQSI